MFCVWPLQALKTKNKKKTRKKGKGREGKGRKNSNTHTKHKVIPYVKKSEASSALGRLLLR